MENSTRERILDEALIHFAENGYKGANLRDLAARLGLSKSALYKHYESKEAIWNALLDKMEAYYARRVGSVDNPPQTPATLEEFISLSMGMIRFSVCDPQIILTRKLLLTEQFHDERVRRLASKHFLEGMTNIFAGLFVAMMESGLLRKEDPTMLAFAYTAPVSVLIHHSDREAEHREEMLNRIEAFIRYFVLAHKVD